MSQYFDTIQKQQCFSTPTLIEQGPHSVMKNISPDIKTKYVNIDSRYREPGTIDSSVVQYELPQTITNILTLKVSQMEIPLSFYNFSASRGNTFFQIENTSSGVVSSIQIEDGYYTFSSIVTEINEQIINNDIGNLYVTIDNTTNKIMFNNDNENDNANEMNNHYKLYFDVNSNLSIKCTDNHNKPLNTKLGWALGFRQSIYSLDVGTEIMSEGSVDLFPIRYLYLAVDEFSQSNPNSFLTPSYNWYMNPNVLARISLDPNTYSFGSIISINEEGGRLKSDIRTYGGKTDIKRLHIQLLDEQCNVLSLNQMDFSFLLEISHQ